MAENEMKKRIAVIGAGFIGRTHINAAAKVADIKVTGFLDEHAKADRPEFVGLTQYRNIADIVSDEVVGVVVATPDDLHVPIARECLEHGLFVMLEKPAARSLSECALLARARNAGSHLQIAHQRRHHGATQAAIKLIEDGHLGRLIGVSGVLAFKKDDNYFLERPRGVVLTNLVHDLDLLQLFCGDLVSISANVSHLGRGANEEDTVAICLEFETGVIGTFLATDYAPGPWGWDQATKELPSIPYDLDGTTYTLLGTGGSLAVPDMRLYQHRTGESWHQPLARQTVDAALSNAYSRQLAHFGDLMAGHATPSTDIATAMRTQAGLEAALISGKTGQRIPIQRLIDEAMSSQQTECQ